ncbi:2-dehydropantoate 2-reductase [Streptomyces canus]|uniref:ketopantoate reductase family protein n=1 Tax=Streptomyces canus TaxID=58343 RepID=UPI0033CD1195
MALRITIVGPGAVGATLAASFTASGAQVSLLGAPGAHLDAIAEQGLVVESGSTPRRHHLVAAADPAHLPMPALVVICVKGQDLSAAVASIRPWIVAGADVLVVANGVPWWLLATVSAAHEQVIRAVDPDGSLLDVLPPSRVMAGVAHFSSSVQEAGHVTHSSGDRLIVGDPLGGRSVRVDRVAEALHAGPVRAEVSTDIRTAIWDKLLGNVNLNPVSALTGGTVLEVLEHPVLRRLCADMFTEAAEVGAKLGIETTMSADERLEVAGRLGNFRTSMLQDSDRGRPLETDAILGAVRELAQRAGVPTPCLDTVEGLLSMRERTRHLKPGQEPG